MNLLNYMSGYNDIDNDYELESLVTYQKNKKRIKRFRITKTVFLFLLWIGSGFSDLLIGPMLPELRKHVNTNYKGIGISVALRYFGVFVGVLISGFLSDMLKRQRNILIVCGCLLYLVTTVLIPYLSKKILFDIDLYFHGLAYSITVTAGTPILYNMWNEKSVGPMNIMHAGTGIGGMVGPLIAQAFGRENEPFSQVSTTIESNATVASLSLFNSIEKPFLTAGLYFIPMAIIFFIYAFIQNPADEDEVSIKCCGYTMNDDDLNSESDDNVNDNMTAKDLFLLNISSIKILIQSANVLSVLVFLLIFVGFFFSVPELFVIYIYSFGIESDLQISKMHSALINSLFWIFFTFGRFSTSLISMKVTPSLLLLLSTLGQFLISVLFFIFPHILIVYYVFIIGFAVFSTVYVPTCLGLLGNYVTINGVVVMYTECSIALGTIVLQYVTGYLIEIFGIHILSLIIMSISSALLIQCVLLLTILQFW